MIKKYCAVTRAFIKTVRSDETHNAHLT